MASKRLTRRLYARWSMVVQDSLDPSVLEHLQSPLLQSARMSVALYTQWWRETHELLDASARVELSLTVDELFNDPVSELTRIITWVRG